MFGLRKAPRVEPFAYDGELDVVGESAYTANIRAVRRAEGATADDEIEVAAWLVREPTNKYDGNAVAVAVQLKGAAHTVGYLPRTIAAKVAPLIDAANKRRVIPSVVVRISEPFKSDGKTLYSVDIARR